ncbi:LysR family transcriptional regulator [Rhodoplanes elegans]|uniref:LysR family transcriptional regulator n=1 Tax=Rhodoplanes elegans TaxID=29408 RepID=A0A327JTQ2_9BRAD|nr:LysR family transcriptional regulator [Rhodoplanes elegans]MBK5957364.1 LysR family transcriptional regulator [Rhodoplanes elegans]RAI29441.1 LysR family transcriptional regulator [Rhodoplanes elegans]
MLDRVTGMQVFARVAGLGSLSAAGRALGMSQTMATKHLAALEARLGTKLLHRTTRRLTLTEAGRRYLESVERILAELEEADATASAETVEVRGTLRLNAPFSFGIREIAPLLPEFSRRHPDLVVDLGLNDRVVDLIEEGWDMVVRIGRMQSSTLVARKLAPSRLMVCAAPSYLERRGTPRTIADLAGYDCLGYTLSQTVGAGRWAFGRDARHVVEVRGSLAANNGDALVVAAVGGQGLVYMPSFLVAREIRAGLLVPLVLDEPTPELSGVYAAYPSNRRPPAKVRAFIDLLAERFAPVPPWDRDAAPA